MRGERAQMIENGVMQQSRRREYRSCPSSLNALWLKPRLFLRSEELCKSIDFLNSFRYARKQAPNKGQVRVTALCTAPVVSEISTNSSL